MVCLVLLQARATLSHVLMWNVTAITVWAQGLTPTEQCAALREALPLLQRMRDTVYILQEQSGQDDHYAFNVLLRDLTVTQELASDLQRYAEHWTGFALCNLQWPEDTVITTPFPHLGHLGFTNTLDDNLLAKVVTTVTSMDSSLCSPKVWLQEPVPPGTRLPFKAVSVESITVTELLDSAVKLGGGIEWQCEELVICVGPDQVRVCARRQTMHAHTSLHVHTCNDTARHMDARTRRCVRPACKKSFAFASEDK